jgi:hypothetical protein
LLLCLPFATSTETGAPRFNTDLLCKSCKPIGLNQRENARERGVLRLSTMESATFVPATFINALGTREFPHCGKGTDHVRHRFSAETVWS